MLSWLGAGSWDSWIILIDREDERILTFQEDLQVLEESGGLIMTEGRTKKKNTGEGKKAGSFRKLEKSWADGAAVGVGVERVRARFLENLKQCLDRFLAQEKNNVGQKEAFVSTLHSVNRISMSLNMLTEYTLFFSYIMAFYH